MELTSDTYCAGCVTRRTGPTPCAQCAWDDNRNPEGHAQLPRHTLLVGRYYMGRVLGQGGFGITYLARDLRLNRAVAIKEYFPTHQCSRLTNRITVISYDGDKGQQYQYGLKRFLEEGQTIARFNDHPCIVPILDVLEENGTAYLIMSYEEGIDLKAYLANRGGKLPYADAIKIIMPVMDALREVHAHGILHRDISPDNVFLTRSGHIKLLDFGAARQAIGEQSRSLSVILKQGYAPEEQYRTRGNQGTWTDVYAVAATLYRCITGELPPPALDRLSEDELRWPSAHCPDLPVDKEQVILKALAVRGNDRFQTVQEFQHALLVSTAPPSPKALPPENLDSPLEMAKQQSPPKIDEVIPILPGPLYSVRSIWGSSLLGTPLAGIVLLSLNYRQLGLKGEAQNTLVYGLLALFGIDVALGRIPNAPAALSYVAVAVLGRLANQLQGPAIKAHVAAGGTIHSGWRAFFIGLGCLVLTIGVVFLAVVLWRLGNA